MRVIAGDKRSIPLLSVPGMATRPTTDRIKETLFNILQNELPGCRFLDLYAGSGQMGTEALSRGATEAVLVDSGREAVDVIRKNLQKTGLSDQALVRPQAVSSFLATYSGKPFDIIFMDPPYDLHEEREILSIIAERGLLAEDGRIIVEADQRNLFYEDLPEGLVLTRLKDYKKNRHVFLGRSEDQ